MELDVDGDADQQIRRQDTLHHNEIQSLRRIKSIETVDRPPSSISERQVTKPWNPLSIHILALLVPASLLGVLTRLGLHWLASYDGSAIFPLAYAQGLGCFVMGFALQLKEPFGHLCAFVRNPSFSLTL